MELLIKALRNLEILKNNLPKEDRLEEIFIKKYHSIIHPLIEKEEWKALAAYTIDKEEMEPTYTISSYHKFQCVGNVNYESPEKVIRRELFIIKLDGAIESIRDILDESGRLHRQVQEEQVENRKIGFQLNR